MKATKLVPRVGELMVVFGSDYLDDWDGNNLNGSQCRVLPDDRVIILDVDTSPRAVASTKFGLARVLASQGAGWISLAVLKER